MRGRRLPAVAPGRRACKAPRTAYKSVSFLAAMSDQKRSYRSSHAKH